jgi:hypothetical protein
VETLVGGSRIHIECQGCVQLGGTLYAHPGALLGLSIRRQPGGWW